MAKRLTHLHIHFPLKVPDPTGHVEERADVQAEDAGRRRRTRQIRHSSRSSWTRGTRTRVRRKRRQRRLRRPRRRKRRIRPRPRWLRSRKGWPATRRILKTFTVFRTIPSRYPFYFGRYLILPTHSLFQPLCQFLSPIAFLSPIFQYSIALRFERFRYRPNFFSPLSIYSFFC